jgi:DNA-binding HxlR family transcriptional regulator
VTDRDRAEGDPPGSAPPCSGARGPRFSYSRESSGESKEPPSGQFQAWSPVQTASEVLAKRWKSVIIWLLGRRRRRFNELASHLPGITPKVLTEQLRELERDGLIERSVIRGGAKHVEYALTAIGETLRPILEQLQQWGREYQATRSEKVLERERELGAAKHADGHRQPSPPRAERDGPRDHQSENGRSPH